MGFIAGIMKEKLSKHDFNNWIFKFLFGFIYFEIWKKKHIVFLTDKWFRQAVCLLSQYFGRIVCEYDFFLQVVQINKYPLIVTFIAESSANTGEWREEVKLVISNKSTFIAIAENIYL